MKKRSTGASSLVRVEGNGNGKPAGKPQQRRGTGTLRRGQIVEVIFWDHAEGATKRFKCAAFGRVGKIERETIYLDAWTFASPRRAYERENVTRFAIIRSTIETITRLVPE